MRRTILSAVGAVASLALVAACSANGGNDTDSGSADGADGNGADDTGADDNGGPSGDITFWMFPIIPDNEAEVAYWDKVSESFMEEYPDVDLTIEIQPWANRGESLASAVAAGSQPDLIYLNPGQIAQYGDIGALEPVQDRLDASIIDNLREHAVAGMSYEDNLYALPVLTSVNATIWNTQVLEDAGIEDIPTTWDEALEIAPVLQDEGKYLTQYDAHAESTMLHAWYPLLWQAGGEVLNEDGTASAFNSAAGLEALELVKTLVDEGFVPSDPLTSRVPLEQSAFASGDMAMIFHQSVGQAANLIDEDDLYVGAPLEIEQSVGHGTVGGFAPMSGSDSDEAVTAFLEFYAQEEILTEMLLESGFYSATNDIGQLHEEDTILGQEESYQDFTDPGPVHLAAGDIHPILAAHIQDVLLNDADPQAALDAAAAEVDAAIERQG